MFSSSDRSSGDQVSFHMASKSPDLNWLSWRHECFQSNWLLLARAEGPELNLVERGSLPDMCLAPDSCAFECAGLELMLPGPVLEAAVAPNPAGPGDVIALLVS